MALERTAFSVYMLRPGEVTAVEQRLFSNATPLNNGLNGFFLPVPSKHQPPQWLKALRPYLSEDVDTSKIKVQSPAALLLIRRRKHTFVLSFGHAWQKLLLHWQELEFGRRVVLNTVPPEQVIEVSSQQIFTRKHVSHERSPRPTSVKEFGIEYDRDLVAALGGKPSEDVLGGSVRGGGSLRLNLHFPTIGNVLDKAAEFFESNAYKTRYPDIDNVVPIAEPTHVAVLDKLLDDELKSGAAKKKAALFCPTLLRGEDPIAEEYGFGRAMDGMPKAPFLLYGSWENHLAKKKEKPSVANARGTPVHLFDESGDRFHHYTVYECLSYDLYHENEQYVLSAGIWYKADIKFVKQVNRYVDHLKPTSHRLPDRNRSETEPDYNIRCCESGELLHFDAKNVPFAQQGSKFEFCDFMHPRKKILFFAKIPTRSSDCSHLVEQIRRTEELLFSVDGSFRKNLKRTFRKHYPEANSDWLDTKPNRWEWKLCLVSLGKDRKDLPFFAKCSVWRLARQLEHQGNPFFFQSV
jgi:uncharacterized protein (TIGR04141 family)